MQHSEAVHLTGKIPTSRSATSCWAGSSRGGRRSSTPPRCAGCCRR